MQIVLARFVQVLLIATAVAFAGPAGAQDQNDASEASDTKPSNIEERLRRIEDSIIDMRAMIGALQSMGPGDSTASTGNALENTIPEADASDEPSGDSEDPLAQTAPDLSSEPAPEIQQLEIQVQALSAQLSETVKRLNRLEAAIGQSSDAGDADVADAQPSLDDETSDFGAQEAVPEGREVMPEGDTGFGTTTVQSSEAASEEDAATWPDDTMAAEAMETGQPEAQALFAQAYDALQAQDYAAAREGFEEFLQTYPDDPLANNARYWLADAAFGEGDFVVAANNFVKVYNSAPTGDKSEETLLKLAIVLRRLERSESACDALSRLDGRLEGMSQSFRQRVDEERRRSECG